MSKAQLYIVQDLGISKQDIEGLISLANLPYQVIYANQEANPALVEGLININAKLDAAFLASFPQLKFIAVAFTGYDSVDLAYCKDKGIAVYNVPTYATDSVAELTLGVTLSWLREIHTGNVSIRQGAWNLGEAGTELKGKTVGIVGTGRIGIRVAELFSAFGCEIKGWSKSKRSEFETLGEYVDDLKDLCSQVDILCLHLPLNTQTKGIIGEAELAAMKESALLVNMARGPVVQQDALVDALKSKNIAGAAIDVFDQEPIDASHPYCSLDEALLTPHIAYKTNEALVRRASITLANIQNYLTGNTENRVL